MFKVFSNGFSLSYLFIRIAHSIPIATKWTIRIAMESETNSFQSFKKRKVFVWGHVADNISRQSSKTSPPNMCCLDKLHLT